MPVPLSGANVSQRRKVDCNLNRRQLAHSAARHHRGDGRGAKCAGHHPPRMVPFSGALSDFLLMPYLQNLNPAIRLTDRVCHGQRERDQNSIAVKVFTVRKRLQRAFPEK